MVDLVEHDAVHGGYLVPDACTDVLVEVVFSYWFDFFVGFVQVAGVEFDLFDGGASEKTVCTVDYQFMDLKLIYNMFVDIVVHKCFRRYF